MTKWVGLPDNIWGRLASRAEVAGVDVADLLVDGVTHILDSPAPRPPRAPRVVEKKNLGHGALVDVTDPEVMARIRDLVEKNYSQHNLAEAFGVSRDGIRTALRKLDISADGRRRPNATTKETRA